MRPASLRFLPPVQEPLAPPQGSLGPSEVSFILSQPVLPLAYRGEFSKVVEGAKGIKLLQSQQQGLVWRRVQEVKVHQVVDPWRKE